MSRKATSGAQSLDGAGFLRLVIGSGIGIVTGSPGTRGPCPADGSGRVALLLVL